MPRRRDRAAAIAGVISLCLSACGGSNSPTDGENTPMATAQALESLAIDSGVINEGAVQDLAGSYGRNYDGSEDRLCLVRQSGRQETYQAGLEIHIGEEENCRGAGLARRTGSILNFSLAEGRCVIAAHYDGDKIVMPGAVDEACATLCSTRGSLAGVGFPLVAAGAQAGRAVVGKSGEPLCP